MNVFAAKSNPNNKVKAGRLRAASRVRQRQKRESLRWSPSGKLRSPPSQQSPTTTTIDVPPWNERFIFDDESQHKGTTHSNNRRIASTSRRGCDEKENIANSTSTGNRIRHYTERSDGDAVSHFQQIEVSTSSAAAAAGGGVGRHPHLVETRSIALSPFNMAKVKAALQADSRSQRKTPHLPFNITEVESILDTFEELIFTMEIEEELARRDLELAKLRSEIKEPLSSESNESKHKSGTKEETEFSESTQLNTCVSDISKEIEDIVKQSAEGILKQLRCKF